MIVVEDVQIIPQQVIIGQQFRLKVRAYEEIQYANTTQLQQAIDMVNQYNPSDYKDFTGVASNRDAGLILLHEHPTIDRQDEVDAAAQAIFDVIAALEWAEGQKNNPIPYKHLMEVTQGLYYSYKGNIYRCLLSASSSLMFPGTAPKYWEKI